jgi:outer membrane protein assembly factor BamD
MKNISTFLSRLAYLLLALTVFTACKNDNLIKQGDTLPTAYKKSMALYQSDDYTDAAKAFEKVIQLGRGTDYAQEAQYYLAESYFNDDRYLLASSEYGRYVTLFPRADKREEAQFKEAYSYYKLSPRYRLDQSHTRTAIEKLQLFNSRYSSSERAQQAAKYITDLRARLAKKLFYSADLYMRTDSYEAAIVYYDLTIDNYPESIWAQRALVNKIDTYVIYADRSVTSKQRERYQSAVEAYEKFIQLFPEGKYRQQADKHVDEAREGLAGLGNSDSTNSSVASSDSGANSE